MTKTLSIVPGRGLCSGGADGVRVAFSAYPGGEGSAEADKVCNTNWGNVNRLSYQSLDKAPNRW